MGALDAAEAVSRWLVDDATAGWARSQSRRPRSAAIDKNRKSVMPLAGIEDRIISIQDQVRWVLHVHRANLKSRQCWSAESNQW